MVLLPNDWNAIRAFYREAEPDILTAGRNEWGMDLYAWDELGIIYMTPIECWLWHDIRANDAVLYPQYPVSRYFVDFANPVAKVAIECDGAAYHTDTAKDARRDAELAQLGWSVYRAPGWLCRTDFNPETRELGQAFIFIRDICEQHGISRNSRVPADEHEFDDPDEWVPMPDLVEQVIKRLQRRYEMQRAVRLAQKKGKA